MKTTKQTKPAAPAKSAKPAKAKALRGLNGSGGKTPLAEFVENSRGVRPADGITTEAGKGLKPFAKGQFALSCYGIIRAAKAGAFLPEGAVCASDPRKLGNVTLGKLGKLLIVRRTTAGKGSNNLPENAFKSADAGKTWDSCVIRSNAEWTHAKTTPALEGVTWNK